MTAYRALLERLFAARRSGIVWGLDRVATVLAASGWQRADLGRVVHVGGTNGKGSTVAMLAAIARGAGARVGRYTSPHLSSLRERIVVDDALISEAEIVAHAARADQHGLAELTFFEQVTVLGLLHLAAARPDVTVLEVGLGGRLDATNVVDADVAVVTGIAMDHEGMLGTTIDAIAGEKAGIFKAGQRLVIGASGEAAAVPTLRAAATVGRSVVEVDARMIAAVPALGLRGAHQRTNAAAAIAAIAAAWADGPLGGHVAPTAEVITRALGSATHPGRLETIATTPTVIVDGAHNPNGAAALAAAMRDLPRPRVLVVAVSSDKDVDGMLAPLVASSDLIIATTYDQPRALAAPVLAAHAVRLGARVGVHPDSAAALVAARAAAGQGGTVIVAGSLMLVGEVRARLLGGPVDPLVVSDPAPPPKLP